MSRMYRLLKRHLITKTIYVPVESFLRLACSRIIIDLQSERRHSALDPWEAFRKNCDYWRK